MLKNSEIEWTGPTWNPWQGCKKKSAGCKFCYMYRDKKRYGQDPTIVVRSAPATFNKPLKLQKEVERGLRPDLKDRLVFTCSWSDWFNEEADEWRPEAWQVISQCPDLIFQILTKLPQRILNHLPDFWDEIKDRCWMGTSVENQEADWRIDELRKVNAGIRFLSCEPLLEGIDLNDSLLCQFIKGPMIEPQKGTINGKSFPTVRLKRGIDWVIVGGESGPYARPFDLAWAEDIIAQCAAADVPVFVKQLGSNPIDGLNGYKTGYPVTGKGGNPAEWPAALRVREWPEVTS